MSNKVLDKDSEDKPVKIIIKYKVDGLMKTEYVEVPFKVAKYIVSLINRIMKLEHQIAELKG